MEAGGVAADLSAAQAPMPMHSAHRIPIQGPCEHQT